MIANRRNLGTRIGLVLLGFGLWGARAEAQPADWSTVGNAGTTPGLHMVGTTDANDLGIGVFQFRNIYIDYTGPTSTPNIIEGACPLSGSGGNRVTSGVVGAAIGGGGTTTGTRNQVTDSYGVVGGGDGNTAGGGRRGDEVR